MKTVKYILIAAVAFFAAACSPQSKELSIDKSSVRLHAGEEAAIGPNMPAEWSCDNEFVASVDDRGVVRGEHVGTAIMTAVSGNERKECTIEVTPRYDTYIEPAYELLYHPVSSLEGVETRELMSHDEKAVIYKGEQPYIKYVEYRCGISEDKNFIYQANIYIEDSYKDEVTNFLTERYRVVEYENSPTQYYNNFYGKASVVAFLDGNINDPGFFVVSYGGVSSI